MKPIVYSFDVFDTSIVRIWAKPTDLFLELGYQLQKDNLIQVSPESWASKRMEVEKTTRDAASNYEITLEGIYENLARSFNWSDNEVEKAIQTEIEIELLSLRPVPATKKKIQSLHQANERVIFISDMYLPEKAIRTFLKENNLWAPGDTVYVSSEVKLNKGTGKIFEYCLAQESVNPSQMYHVGDHLHADVEVPRKLGIPSESFTQAHLNRYERKIADTTELPLKFRSLTAGASRLTRLQSQETSFDQQVIWETTASAIAPMLFGFVYWCLVEAQKRGIQRLYFVARDGQILEKIAQVICKNWGFTIECRYIYGSRQAWNLPAIQEIGKFELDWILFYTQNLTQFVSIRSICDRVNISPDQIKDVLSRYDFPPTKWDLNLHLQERELLKEVFTHKEVTELILSSAATCREKAIGYFRQEGLGDGVPFGFVDVGWSGRSQRCLSRLLDIAGFYPKSGVCGFYFALESRVKPFQNDHLMAYFYDVEKPSDRHSLCQYRCLYELFLAADHGSTKGYDQCGDQYIPLLRSPTNEQAINWGLYVLQSAAVEYAEQITTHLSELECTAELFLKVTEIVAKEFVLSPSSQEAQVFGSFVFSGDITENAFYELAPIYTLADWWRLLLYNSHPHEDVWLPASAARGNVIVRKLYKLRNGSKNRMILKTRRILGEFRRGFLLKLTKPT